VCYYYYYRTILCILISQQPLQVLSVVFCYMLYLKPYILHHNYLLELVKSKVTVPVLSFIWKELQGTIEGDGVCVLLLLL